MEERAGWGSAFGTAWGNLTGVNNEGNVRAIRLLFFLIFLLGTGWAVWSYMQGLELIELEEAHAVSRTNQAQVDKNRLDAMIKQVEVTSQLRLGSQYTVEVMEETLAKYPFAEPRMAPDIPSPSIGDRLAVEMPYIDYPPEITLRGIMIMGKQHIAVMDIPGVGTGMIVRAGDTFMQKKGRVVRIAPDKVVINWGGKNWEIAPTFR